MQADWRRRIERCGRWLALAAIAFGAAACGSSPECKASYPTVDVVVVGGASAFVSYALSGACTGGGTPADCHAESCGGATPCPCHIAVPIDPGPNDGEATSYCRIEVASTGTYFVVDVGVIDWSAPCRTVELADSSQATITVDFTARAGP